MHVAAATQLIQLLGQLPIQNSRPTDLSVLGRFQSELASHLRLADPAAQQLAPQIQSAPRPAVFIPETGLGQPTPNATQKRSDRKKDGRRKSKTDPVLALLGRN